jgi:iron complex outermembrane receptor protein
VLLAGLPVAALAAEQAAPADEGTIGEITVTATKRASSLQKVPFSIAAVSEQDLRDRGATNIVELARNVAGLAIADLGPGQSQIAIRGISSGQVIRDQPGVKEQVGVYLDESPISVALFTPDLDFYDLERFEVLRGPQGTLFGAGSTSGTLRYITAQPKLGKVEGSFEVGLSAVKDGSDAGDVKAAVNFPMGDKVAARLVGYYNRLPGWVDALQPSGAVSNDVNTGKKDGVRVALLWQPNDNWRITPRFVYQDLQTNGYPRVDLWNILGDTATDQPGSSFGKYGQFTQQPEGMTDNFRLGDLKIAVDIGPTELTSISSYTDRSLVVLRDASQLTGSVTVDVGGTAGEARLTSPLYDSTKLKVFSQELRLASTANDTLEWLVGGFYQKVDRHYGQDLPTPGYDAITSRLFGVVSTQLNAPPDTPFYSNLFYNLKQYGAFGEATYNFSSQWGLTAGARYYKFDEDRVLNFGGFFSDPTPPGGVPGSTTSDGVSPRVILTYRPNNDLQFNLQASRGFRLGGINDPINLPLCSADDAAVFGNQKTWNDEENTNYELGAKMLLMDRRVTLNVAAFYSDIKDLQATTTAGTCSSRIVFNVPKARSEGVEAELFARPTANWDFGVSATWVTAELRSSVTSTDSLGQTVVVGGLASGNRLPTGPEFQGVASVGYTHPIGGGSNEMFANITYQHVGSSFSQFENEVANFGSIGTGLPGAARLISIAPSTATFDFAAELPSYDIANFRVGMRTAAGLETALYVNNFTNTRAILALDYERGRSARVGNLINQPLTVGVTVRKSF